MKEECKHKFLPLGFQKIDATESKVEVIACIVCEMCGLFRTKILYYDRQREKREEIEI